METERKKILIADDNKTFLMYMAILLKRMGFTVILAENGVETIKLMKMMRPDLVLLDSMMPVMDGISVLRFIKKEKQLAETNIVMVTADSSPETIKTSKELDVCGYIIKPVDIDILHDMLQECIFKPVGFVRKHPRIPFTEKIKVYKEEIVYDLYAETLSEGGIYVRLRDPFPVGTEVGLTLPLKEGVSLSLRGCVIYVKGLYADLFRVPPGMAIEFGNTSPADALFLKNHISEVLAKDIWEAQEEVIIGLPKNR
jgi:CheY-like chemotaxis protein